MNFTYLLLDTDTARVIYYIFSNYETNTTNIFKLYTVSIEEDSLVVSIRTSTPSYSSYAMFSLTDQVHMALLQY